MRLFFNQNNCLDARINNAADKSILNPNSFWREEIGCRHGVWTLFEARLTSGFREYAASKNLPDTYNMIYLEAFEVFILFDHYDALKGKTNRTKDAACFAEVTLYPCAVRIALEALAKLSAENPQVHFEHFIRELQQEAHRKGRKEMQMEIRSALGLSDMD